MGARYDRTGLQLTASKHCTHARLEVGLISAWGGEFGGAVTAQDMVLSELVSRVPPLGNPGYATQPFLNMKMAPTCLYNGEKPVSVRHPDFECFLETSNHTISIPSNGPDADTFEHPSAQGWFMSTKGTKK